MQEISKLQDSWRAHFSTLTDPEDQARFREHCLQVKHDIEAGRKTFCPTCLSVFAPSELGCPRCSMRRNDRRTYTVTCGFAMTVEGIRLICTTTKSGTRHELAGWRRCDNHAFRVAKPEKLEALTVSQLRKLAEALGIKVASKATKAQLIEELS